MSQFFQGATAGSLPPSVPLQFTGNVGVGIPSGNNFNIEGAGSITVTMVGDTATITESGGGLTWTDEALSFAAVSNNGYFVSATATATLPAAPSQGDVVEFVITNIGVTLTIQANAGQFICIGTDLSVVAGNTVGAQLGNSISFTYQASSTTWFSVTAPQGSWVTT